LPAEGRGSLTLEALLQSVNNIGLKKHLLVAKINIMEKAIGLGKLIFKPITHVGLL